MTWRHYLFLFFICIIVLVITTTFQTVPGYMDAEYYYLGGLQLVKGEGFTEPILWNYLDNPAEIPHPSHAYWMPLASIIAAGSMWMFGLQNFLTAKVGFVLLGIPIPLMTAFLAERITGNQHWATTSGFLAIFSGYFLPYITTTDTFAINMLLGGSLFLLLPKFTSLNGLTIFISGIIAGLMHLSRADGIIWAAVFTILLGFSGKKNNIVLKTRFKFIAVFICGYFLVMGPWMVRNLSVFGTILSPGSTRTIWLTNYDQLFSYPVSKLTFQNWWASGIVEILKTRLWALGVNLQRVLAEQGLIFLTPLILLGLWKYRSDIRIRAGVWAWLLTFGLMTFIFPFAGARGGLFHSSAALQPLFWTLTPAGLEQFINWGYRNRGWNPKQASLVLGSAVILFAAILSVFLFTQRVIGINDGELAWNQTASKYQVYETALIDLGAAKDDIVMVKNPPGYHVVNNRKAIPIPEGNAQTLYDAAKRYAARYIILEVDHPEGLTDLYEQPSMVLRGIRHLLSLEGTQIFIVE